MLQLFNSWCPGIVVTNDECEGARKTTFLDLCIVLNGSSIYYCTFRKPLNAYAYLPFDSNHPLSSKLGIVATECMRLLITNKEKASYDSQRAFFADRLQDRGYPWLEIMKQFVKYPWHAKATLLERRHTIKKHVVAFKLVWSPGLEKLGFSSVVKSRLSLSDDVIKNKLRAVMCFTSAPNIFRLQYGRFTAPKLHDGIHSLGRNTG